MTVTAKQVYDSAMVLIDEVLETGSILPDQPEYYESKAKLILTTLQAALLPSSQTPEVITDLSQNMLLSDKVSLSVVPYGLAAHLLIQEDPNTAAYFNAMYDELKRKQPTESKPITDSYDVLGGMI